jgi:hypothetical protein
MNGTATYLPSLTAANALERVNDMLRDATASRAAAQLTNDPTRHRTPRRRPVWWVRVTARSVTARAA